MRDDDPDEDDELLRAIQLSSVEHLQMQERILNEIQNDYQKSTSEHITKPSLLDKDRMQSNDRSDIKKNPFSVKRSLPLSQEKPVDENQRPLPLSPQDKNRRAKERNLTDSLYAKFQIESPSPPPKPNGHFGLLSLKSTTKRKLADLSSDKYTEFPTFSVDLDDADFATYPPTRLALKGTKANKTEFELNLTQATPKTRVKIRENVRLIGGACS
jgi:hypothetical protein